MSTSFQPTQELDFAAEADGGSEALTIAAIEERYPTDGMLAEESDMHGKGSEITWVADPLNGTYNFAHNTYRGASFHPWDYSPLVVLFKEAGMVATDFSGNEIDLRNGIGSILAAPVSVPAGIVSSFGI